MQSPVNSVIWERFFNWQSDQDWTWGPFVSMRPIQSEPIRPWVWLRLFLIFTGLGMTLTGTLVSVYFIVSRAISKRQLPASPIVSDTLATVQGMLLDPTTQIAVASLFLSLPLLFALFCLPYHWAWNRRANRLVGHGPPKIDSHSVWPPAPTDDFEN
jgi:hypothetical protein